MILLYMTIINQSELRNNKEKRYSLSPNYAFAEPETIKDYFKACTQYLNYIESGHIEIHRTPEQFFRGSFCDYKA